MAFSVGEIEARLTLDRTPFHDELERAKAEARDFADKDYTARLSADGRPAEDTMQRISLALDKLGHKRETAHVAVDDSGAVAKLDALSAKLDSIGAAGGAGMGGMLGAAALLGPTLATPLAGLGAGLAGTFAAAGAGAAAFGGLVASPIKQAIAVQQQLSQALLSGNAKMIAQARTEVGNLSGPAHEFLTALQQIGKTWNNLTGSLQTGAMKVVVDAMRGLVPVIKELEPLFKASIPAVSGFVKILESGLASGGFKTFVSFLAGQAGPALSTLAHVFVDLGKGIAGLVQASRPLITTIEGGLVSLFGHFANWGQSLIPFAGATRNLGLSVSGMSAAFGHSATFTAFVRLVKADGHLIVSIFNSLWKIFAAMTPTLLKLGTGFLSVAASLLKMIIPFVEAHPRLVALATAALLLWKSFGHVATSLGSTTISMVKMAVAHPIISAIAAALVGIGLAAYEIVEHWKGFSHFWESMWKHVEAFFRNGWVQIGALVITPMIGVPLLIIEHWKQIPGFFEKVWKGARDAFSVAWAVVKATVIQPFDAAAGALVGAWRGTVGGFVTAWKAITGAFGSAYATVKHVVGEIVGFLSSMPHKIISALSGLAGSLANVASDAWRRFENAGKITVLGIFGFVKAIPGEIVGALGNLGSLLYQAGRNVIMGLVHGIESAIGSVFSAMGRVASAIRNHLPFSPAKVGPLSGMGSPEIAGAKIGSMLSAGLVSSTPTIAAAASTMLGPLSAMRAGDAVANPMYRLLLREWHVERPWMELLPTAIAASLGPLFTGLSQDITGAISSLGTSLSASLSTLSASGGAGAIGVAAGGSSAPVGLSGAGGTPTLQVTKWGQWVGNTQYGRAPGGATAVYFASAAQADAFYAKWGDKATYYNAVGYDWKTMGRPGNLPGGGAGSPVTPAPSLPPGVHLIGRPIAAPTMVVTHAPVINVHGEPSQSTIDKMVAAQNDVWAKRAEELDQWYSMGLQKGGR